MIFLHKKEKYLYKIFNLIFLEEKKYHNNKKHVILSREK